MLTMINTTALIDAPTGIAIVERLIPEGPDAAVVAGFEFEPELELKLGLKFRLELVEVASVIDRAVVRKRPENEDPST